MNIINQRIAVLRSKMEAHSIDALIIPSNDPHQSEYVSEHWKTREYFSGFDGSAGTLVVTKDYVALWTDSRYFLQATEQLDGTEVKLHKQSVPHAPEHVSWICSFLSKGSKIGYEGLLFSLGQFSHLQDHAESTGMELINVDGIASEAWPDRPAMPDSKVYEFDVKYAGRSRGQKLDQVREAMSNADFCLVSALDEIAWALNIRASDVARTPVALSYLLIGKKDVIWCIDSYKIPSAVLDSMSRDVQIRPYNEVKNVLNEIATDKSIIVDQNGISISLKSSISCNIIESGSLIQPMKAIKNEVEIAHIRKVMAKDGAALTRLYMWLENEVKIRKVKETEVAQKLIQFRSQFEEYRDESFDAIVGYKGNGAIVHYTAQEDSCAEIENEGMLLIDSGGQYLDGTTDITRTICLSEPTDEQKRNFTLVLKGNISLDMIKCPVGTTGIQLDALARMHLWKEGLNYGHGTGHGVGFFLAVHEPPQGFVPSAVTSRGTTGFEAGMFTSNEPGFYKEGEYGIRIENLILAIADVSNEYGDFLRFEALTLFPISSKLIDMSIFTDEEKDWLNNYHRRVYQGISPYLNADEDKWLAEMCKAI